MLQTIINYIMSHEKVILSLVGGGAGLSVALEFLLHKFKVNSKKVAYSLLHVFTVAASLSSYYLGGHSPVPIYAALTIIAQTVHRFVVSPWYTKYVAPFLQYESQQKVASTTTAVNTPAANASTTPSFT